MANRRENDEFSRFYSLLFVVLAIFLTGFSIFYSHLYSSRVVGFAVGSEVLQIDESEALECKGDCPDENEPSETIVEDVSLAASTVSRGASYASRVNSEILLNPSINEQELFVYEENLEQLLDASGDIYVQSSDILKKYSSSEELTAHYKTIVQSIDVISEVAEAVNAALSGRIEERQDEQIELAKWELARIESVEESVEELETYSENIIPLASDEKPEPVVASPVREISADCEYPVSLAAFDNDLVDFGDKGIDSKKGNVCEIENQIVYDVAASSPNLKPFVVSEVDIVPNATSLVQNQVIVALHFERKGDSKNDENVGVVFYRGANSLPTIKLFTSPNYYDVERKISEFIHGLFFRNSGADNYESLTLEQASSIINNARPLPWILWSALFAMIVLYLFFGKFLSPPHKNVINSGKIALARGDYSAAAQTYNDLIKHYSTNFANTDIAEYYDLLQTKIGNENFSKKSEGLLQIPGLSPAFRYFEHSKRVEKMIQDALYEVRCSPKVACARMPIIASAYKSLDIKERERLAPLYENLVYQLKDL